MAQASPQLTHLRQRVATLTRGYNPGQPRDNHGRFGSMGNGAPPQAPEIPEAHLTPEQRALAESAVNPHGATSQCSYCSMMLNSPLSGQRIGFRFHLTGVHLNDTFCPDCMWRQIYAGYRRLNHSATEARRRATVMTARAFTANEITTWSEHPSAYAGYPNATEESRMVTLDAMRRHLATLVDGERHVIPPDAPFHSPLNAFRQRITLLRYQIPTVTRDFSHITYDENLHPRGANGRFIGGTSLKLEAHYQHLASVLSHHQVEASLIKQYGADWRTRGGGWARPLDTARQRAADAKAYLATVTHEGHVGIDALKAYTQAIKAQADDAARHLSEQDKTELQALYHIYDDRSRNHNPFKKDDPLSMPYEEYVRTYQDAAILKQFITRHNTVMAADAKAQGAPKPVRLALSDKAGRLAEQRLDPALLQSIHGQLNARTIALNAAATAARQAQEAAIAAHLATRMTLIQQPTLKETPVSPIVNPHTSAKPRTLGQIRQLATVQDMVRQGEYLGNGTYGDPRGDVVLATLNKELGYDGLPQLVSVATMNTAVDSGTRELWRGVNHAPRGTAFLSGDFYAGFGVFGNGTYAAYGGTRDHRPQLADENGMNYARHFTRAETVEHLTTANTTLKTDVDPGVMMRMMVKSGAKVVTYSDLQQRMEKMDRSLNAYYGKLTKQLEKQAKTTQEYDALSRLIDERDIMKEFLSDAGRLATALGYDAIDVDDQSQMVVLNRTALQVQSHLYNPLTVFDQYAQDYGHTPGDATP